jgi:hypothetical protein
MNPVDPFGFGAAWTGAYLAGLRALAAAIHTPERPPATVTDIREGHAIRARRARQREGRP